MLMTAAGQPLFIFFAVEYRIRVDDFIETIFGGVCSW